MIKQLLILLTLLLMSIGTYGQKKEMQFQHLREEDGLSHATVTSILEDNMGFMWFGTYKGLNRYDGYEMKTYAYSRGENTGLNDDMISSLIQDHNGFIWIGYLNNGLSIFDPKTETFQHFKGGDENELMVPSESVNKIYEDSDNNVWVVTSNGISVISPNRKRREKYYYSTTGFSQINGESVYDVIEDKWNRIWLATDNRKLCVFDKNSKKFSEVEYTNLPLGSKDDNDKKNLEIYNDTLLYISSNNGGLAEYNLLTGNYNTYLHGEKGKGPSSNNIKALQQVNNELWIATDGAGLDIFNVKSKTFENYTNTRLDPTSLSSGVVWSLYQDRQDNVWFGIYLEGVDKYDPRKNFFRDITNSPCNEETLPNKPVLSLYNDSQNRTWVGTDWGGLQLQEKDEKLFKHFSIDGKEVDLPSAYVVKSIAEDRFGNLLIGTYSEGLQVYDRKTKKRTEIKRGVTTTDLPSNHVWAIFTDSEGITWIGTLGGGIAKYDPVTKSIKKLKIGYNIGSQEHIYHIFEDAQNNLWFSTDGGIMIYNRRTDSWSPNLLNDLIEKDHNFNYVKGVYQDNLRHIWIATAAGLIKYLPERNEFKIYNQSDGIPELPLQAITADNFGNLLVISKKYVSQFSLASEKIVSFYVPNNSFNYNALIKKDNGEIIVGGTDGITVFNPQKLKENDTKPPVYITDFDIFNKPQIPSDSSSVIKESISTVREINLDYDQSVINFKYCAINYTETERNKYAYKLEGFDEQWNYVGDRRIATYTNLDPGRYTFKVKASNNHGVWNNEGATVTLFIDAPYWQTTWFRALLIALLLVIFYFAQKVRMQNVKRKYALNSIQAEREKVEIQNQNLEKELDTTKSELANITISHLHKNQSLQQIKQKLEEVSVGLANNDKRKIKRIVKDINKESEDHDYWDKFEHQFNKSHDNFLDRFKIEYPDLSKRELRICAYLRMDLDNQEIATLMNVSVRTLETSRYRIRKKIGLENRKSLTKMITRF
ncbi:two-component regulator propeller domain-containing protein [Flammeovirga kamogawensis]|uniref:HTH luxR-type domain-containing protein n=1 Tax=Flammeovirga kamogawensis TaxID=373891 RepID=A0ABX8GVV4_9BACT|nr:two-component regulator propeller domain-containing protein [Flammeovirga kamogawensis]MBB6459655.1 ligand-binding sensor domain-containing protein/DNA-binding CsgD family transcriptional regulator [Flammeovirga kamogawensis]QWG07282.1 hypothetical protein KM029_18560 [Flammeovirga kamogawensis]TRX69101.1 hypothetical protein EO216_13550 [Flammeovirga kamogawensis]